MLLRSCSACNSLPTPLALAREELVKPRNTPVRDSVALLVLAVGLIEERRTLRTGREKESFCGLRER